MNKRIIIAFFTVAMFAGSSYSQKHKQAAKTAVKRPKKDIKTQYGIASFYADKFHGRRTANGEIFSQKKFTAASNTVPLNTWVKVTNLRNKKTVIVKITDRMHFRNKRLIDLSRIAAGQLGYTGRGLARVRVDVLGKHKPAGSESIAEQ
ncbi:MAG: septal ring lytic transglycosylase RlpA family protein [Bacteroidetes bacterium]|nr:septal ring lytic transglycosylase RlpA family protein [Bacteroidota bacterium]MBS1973156.1 septal ring lytic transglycosylase RlpA family protein [Bacteroidota bacterium]